MEDLTNFHILLFVPKLSDDDFNTCLTLEKKYYDVFFNQWKTNLGSKRNPIYVPNFTFKQKLVGGVLKRNFDFHYVNPSLTVGGNADVAFYVQKYMMKRSDRAIKLQQALRLNYSDDEYRQIWNIVKPRYFVSKHFGQPDDPKVIDHLKKGIRTSLLVGNDFPFFINPDTGQTFPLARYYKTNHGMIYSYDDAQKFYDIQHRKEYYRDRHDSAPCADYRPKSVDEFDRQLQKFDNRCKLFDNDDVFDNF